MLNIFRNIKVNKINEALGIGLCEWQIDYIFKNKSVIIPLAQMQYKQLTIILKQILNKHSKYIWSLKEPLTQEQLKENNLLDWTQIYKGNHKPDFKSTRYLLNWRQIYKKLEGTGLKLAKVRWMR